MDSAFTFCSEKEMIVRIVSDTFGDSESLSFKYKQFFLLSSSLLHICPLSNQTFQRNQETQQGWHAPASLLTQIRQWEGELDTSVLLVRRRQITRSNPVFLIVDLIGSAVLHKAKLAKRFPGTGLHAVLQPTPPGHINRTLETLFQSIETDIALCPFIAHFEVPSNYSDLTQLKWNIWCFLSLPTVCP